MPEKQAASFSILYVSGVIGQKVLIMSCCKAILSGNRFNHSVRIFCFGLTIGALPLEWTVLNKLNSAALQLHHCRAVFLCRCGIIQIVFLHRRKYTQFTLIAPLIVIFYVSGYHIYQRLSAHISVQIVSFSL